MSLAIAQIEELLKKAQKKTAATEVRIPRAPVEPTADDDDIPVGINGLMAATEKLLAVNRGQVPTDERDSLVFKRIHPTSKLMAERVLLDADKPRLGALRVAARLRSLKGVSPFHFDTYTEGHLLGNPLSLPLEEINPLSLLEQARRVTHMGPGGLGSEDAITDEARALHPSQFGFISSIEGPESSKIGVDTRVAWGTKIGSDGRLYQRMYDRAQKRHRWVSPEDLHGASMSVPD